MVNTTYCLHACVNTDCFRSELTSFSRVVELKVLSSEQRWAKWWSTTFYLYLYLRHDMSMTLQWQREERLHVGKGKTWCIRTGLIAQLTTSRNTHCAVANFAEHSYCRCLHRIITFWAEHVIAPLETDSKFVHSAIANSCKKWIKGRWQICVRSWHFISKQPTAGRGDVVSFKGSNKSHDVGRADISENLRASLFNKDLSNEHTFNQIHNAGQY
jgi:hypothetical protein